MKKLAVLFGLVLLVASAGAANAADDWKGWYAGAAIGGGSETTYWTDVDYDWFGGTLDLSKNGFLFSGAVGYNFQPDTVVYGIEFNLNLSTIENSTWYSDDVTVTDEIKGWYGVRGRVGIPAGKALVYASGGLAVIDASYAWEETNDPDDSWDFDSSQLGFTVGFGVEHMLTDNMSLKVDVSRAKFAEESEDNDNGYAMRVASSVDAVLVGLNWGF